MAQINFNKLNCKLNENTKILVWGENEIEIKQYLPIQEKLGIMEEVISASMSQYNYANPVQVEVFTYLAILRHYTNIEFTKEQLENPAELYDLVRSSNLLTQVCEVLPENDFNELMSGINKTVTSFYSYRTSVLGILDALKSDYSELGTDLGKIIKSINDPEALATLKEIAPLLGAE